MHRGHQQRHKYPRQADDQERGLPGTDLADHRQNEIGHPGNHFYNGAANDQCQAVTDKET